MNSDPKRKDRLLDGALDSELNSIEEAGELGAIMLRMRVEALGAETLSLGISVLKVADRVLLSGE